MTTPITPETLCAVHELSQAKARYCLAIDTKDWAAFADLMVPDLEFDVSDGDTGVPVIVGRDRVVEMVSGSLVNAKTAHHVHSPLIEVDGDEATAIWAMQDRLLWGNGRAMTGYGHYHERWVRRDGGWKLASLKLTRLIVDLADTGAGQV